MAELHEILSEMREAAKLTRRQVADAIGETENKLYRWETGRNTPGAEPLVRLLAVYRADPVAVSDRLGGVEEAALHRAAREKLAVEMVSAGGEAVKAAAQKAAKARRRAQ